MLDKLKYRNVERCWCRQPPALTAETLRLQNASNSCRNWVVADARRIQSDPWSVAEKDWSTHTVDSSRDLYIKICLIVNFRNCYTVVITLFNKMSLWKKRDNLPRTPVVFGERQEGHSSWKEIQTIPTATLRDTINYMFLCAQKLMGSQLNLPQGTKQVDQLSQRDRTTP